MAQDATVPRTVVVALRAIVASPRIVAALLFAGALGLRLALATRMVFPPLGDAAYYISVSRNLYAGHGLTVAITWHYQPPPASVVHPSSEYWGPLISLAEWLSFVVFGERLYAALVPGAVAGALLVALTYLWGREPLAAWLEVRGKPAAAAARTGGALALGAALLLTVDAELTYQSVTGEAGMLYDLLAFAATVLWWRALRRAGGHATVLTGAIPLAESAKARSTTHRPAASWDHVPVRASGLRGRRPLGAVSIVGPTRLRGGTPLGAVSTAGVPSVNLRVLRSLFVNPGLPRVALLAFAAGALAGLAYLAQGSAVFLALALGGWWVWRVRRARGRDGAAERARLMGAAAMLLAGGALVVAPWLVRQQLTLGYMFSPEARHNALASSLAEFADYGTTTGLATLWQHGVGEALALRAQVLWLEVHQVTDFLFFPTALPAVVGLALLARRHELARLGLASFVVLLIGFALVFPAVVLYGGYYHAVGALAPFLAWGELAAAYSAAEWVRQHLPAPEAVTHTAESPRLPSAPVYGTALTPSPPPGRTTPSGPPPTPRLPVPSPRRRTSWPQAPRRGFNRLLPLPSRPRAYMTHRRGFHRPPRWRWNPLAPALATVPVLLQVALLAAAFPAVGATARHDQAEYAAIAGWLRAHGTRVVMSDEPAGVSYASGLPAIALPAAQGPAVAYACARHYGAQYLIITGRLGLYPQALHGRGDPRFVPVLATVDYEIYRVIA